MDEEEGVAASISRRGSNSSRRSSISQMVKQSMGLGKHTSKEREEISSITRQIEQLSNSPPLASRPQQVPLKTAEVGRDETENQHRDIKYLDYVCTFGFIFSYASSSTLYPRQ